MVESTCNISKTRAEILNGISNFLTISEIAKHRKTSRQAVYKVLSKLQRAGMVKKIGMVWGLSEKGKGGLHSFMGFTNKLRQHNIGIKIKILETQRNWDKKRNVLMQLPYFNKRVKLKNNSYDLFSFGKMRIKTTSKSIIFHLPTIFDNNVDNAILQAMDIIFDAIPKVENRFKIKLVKDQKLNMTFISQEYARLNDAIARVYKAQDKKLYIVDQQGELRFIADYSFAVNELESVHPNKAGEDMNAVNPFLLDLANNPTTFTEVREVINAQNRTMQGIQQNQLGFDRNMKLHLKVLGDLGNAVGELRKEIKKKKHFNKKI